MNDLTNFLIQLSASFLLFGILAKWYVWPAVKQLPLATALMILILPQCTRYLGLLSLSSSVVDPQLTTTTFAFYQAYGDFAASILAFITVLALRAKWKYAIALAWVFNIYGVLDFIHSNFKAVTENVTQYHFGAFWYIPTIAVPALWIAHILVFKLLMQRRQHSASL